MKKIKAKMTSYIKGQDDETEKIVYLGEEVILNLDSQKNYRFNSDDGVRIVRINTSNGLQIKETFLQTTIIIQFATNKQGKILYFQNQNGKELSVSFDAKLINFTIRKKEIFVHYLILDDRLKRLSETKIYITTGD